MTKHGFQFSLDAILVITILAAGTSHGQNFDAQGISFLGHLDMSDLGAGGGIGGNDIWGWTDATTGKEYALFGRQDATAFVDVSDPRNPTYLGELPSHTGTSVWRDIKVYNDHAFIVSDNNGPHGMQVFDLTQLRSISNPTTFAETSHNDSFRNAHNIAINEDTGFAYVVGSNQAMGGLHIIDISDPLNTAVAGEFGADGYTHDVQVVSYSGPDSRYHGKEIAIASNEDTLTIVDVTDKSATTMLARETYDFAAYNHQGWFDQDQRYFFQNDELDEFFFGFNTRTHVWDLADLTLPEYVGFYEHETQAYDHNLYVKDDLIFQANYLAGLRVLKINDAGTLDLEEIGYFDTVPSTDGPGSGGLWSVYPFFESGNLILSDINSGLYIVRLGLDCDFDGDDDCDLDDINLLTEQGNLVAGVTPPTEAKFDLNGDGTIDELDIAEWLAVAGPENGFGGPFLVGDANLDGEVDQSDYNIWVANRFDNGVHGKNWSEADFNGDGATDLSDLHQWNRNKFTSSLPGGTLVPEPSPLVLVMLTMLGIGGWRRR